jgi:hypothetical protein
MSLTDRPLGAASKAEQKEQQQKEAEEKVRACSMPGHAAMLPYAPM